ncbi:MAG: hypothetical protein WCV92_02640, partial [Candidatus Buchananbacteria bacterium]
MAEKIGINASRPSTENGTSQPSKEQAGNSPLVNFNDDFKKVEKTIKQDIVGEPMPAMSIELENGLPVVKMLEDLMVAPHMVDLKTDRKADSSGINQKNPQKEIDSILKQDGLVEKAKDKEVKVEIEKKVEEPL